MRLADLTALPTEQRRSELAVIFAGGILRVRDRQLISVAETGRQIPLEVAAECLEVSAETVLSVVRGG